MSTDTDTGGVERACDYGCDVVGSALQHLSTSARGASMTVDMACEASPYSMRSRCDQGGAAVLSSLVQRVAPLWARVRS